MPNEGLTNQLGDQIHRPTDRRLGLLRIEGPAKLTKDNPRPPTVFSGLGFFS